jgi:hypothetical protein
MKVLAPLLVLVALVIGACGEAATPAPTPSPTPSPTPVAPPELVVDAADGTFTAPDTVAAGWIKLSAKNLKPQGQCGFLVRLNDTTTPAAFAEAIKAGPTPQVQAMVSLEAFIPQAAPNEIYLRARSGPHAFVCFVAGAGGPPTAKVKMVTVTPATGQAAAEPKSEVTITERDFVFDFPAELKSGPKIVRILNMGQQSHEMLIVKLAAGKTLADLIALASTPPTPGQPPSPPPFEMVGGVGPVAPGGAVVVTLDLKPGTYHALCFLPDTTTKKPHIALGMIQEITVR